MIAEALPSKLSEWSPKGPGPHSFRTSLGDHWQLHLEAEHAESLGCRITEFRLDREASTPISAADLTQWATRSASRITGLLEPLKVIEIDKARSEAILRSDPPANRTGRVYYYEILLRGVHSATLRRYGAERSGGQRHAVPYALTHEVIAKLADDIAAALPTGS